VSADEIIHQPVRLRIMATLNALADGEGIEFTRMKAILHAPTAISARTSPRWKTPAISRSRRTSSRRSRGTRVALTRAGRRAFARHVSYLRDIIDGASADGLEEKHS